MSYEKVKILGVLKRVKKDTGEEHLFLQVETLVRHDIYMTEEAIKQLPKFEQIKGKEALIPVEWGEYRGRPSLSFTDDAAPLPAPARV